MGAAATLFFIALLFFADLFTGRYMLTERDLGPYFIPPRFFWAESIRGLDFPLWNPFQFAGSPFFANPQHGMLYPLNMLLVFLPFDIAFNAIILLHFFLAGLFVYLFMRDWKVSPSGALLSGLIFMLSGFLLSVHSLLSCLLSVIWTPLVMLYFRRALVDLRPRNVILTALFLSISFFGGGVEIVYGNVLLLLLMVLLESPSEEGSEKWLERPQRWRSRVNGMKALFWVGLLFLSLSAVQLIPFLELFFHSIRKDGIPYAEATIWSFAPKDGLLFFLPDVYGYFLDMKKYWVSQCWFKTLYTGGLPFILSLVFFLSGKRRKCFLALLLVSIFLGLGRYNPLYPWLFQYVPFLSGIRYPAKFLYLFVLVLAITSGLGFQRLEEMARERIGTGSNPLFISLSLLSALFLVFLILGHGEIASFLKERGIDDPNFNTLSVNLHHAKRFLFYLAVFFLLLRVGYETNWRPWVKALLLLFLVGDLFGNMGFYGMEKTEDFFRKTPILERINGDRSVFRVFSTRKTIAMDAPLLIGNPSPFEVLKARHLPSLHLLHRVHDLWGVDVIRLKRSDDLYRVFTEAPSITATNLIDLYGVKYVISVTPLDESPDFERLYARLEGLSGKEEDLLKANTVKLYRYGKAFPRAWLVEKARVMEPKAMLSRMAEKGFDPRQEVLLEESIPLGSISPREEGGEQEGRAELLSERNNRIELRVKTPRPAFLVLSDTYFPGWKALVDGKEHRVYQADYAFRAVVVPEGEHRVVFLYRPLSFMVGLVISLVSGVSCGLILWSKRSKGIPHG